MITLLHSLGDYMLLTVKKCLKIYIVRNRINETINEFKYILRIMRPISLYVHNS
jgi:hypothetical protein